MKGAAAAIQDLMRDTAHLFDQASKVNARLLQIDTFVGSADLQAQLANLAQSRRQYKESLAGARACVSGGLSSALDQPREQPDVDDATESLQQARDELHCEAIAKSEEIRQLLNCMRQVQLASAQLVRM
ncbi:hypothetical protein IWW55_006230, partial [Coemansia sp. RSA 2706]